MKNLIKSIVLLMMGLIVSTSCSGNTSKDAKSKMETKETDNKMETKGKVLIVFFSHAGENYSVGNIKEGNTKLVADEIQKVTGGDEFEIVAEKSYDMPYDDLTKLAKEEQEKNEKPAFKGEVKDIDQYDTVFIGGPIWWGTYPQVMFTFFDKYDLGGKTIVPFSTHEGSGLGSVVSDLKHLYPKANFKQAFDIYGHQVRGGKAKIEAWLKGLGY